MRKRLLIILSVILLFSFFFGCTAQKENAQPTSEISVSTTAKTTEKTTEKTTKKTTEKKTGHSKAEKSTTKKETTAKAETTSASTTKKQHTQVESFCYITIECSAINENIDKLKEGHARYVPENGIILAKTKCTFDEGETVFDILEKICSKKGIPLTSRETVYGIYVSGINNLDEFDCGRESGWVYTVNGSSPSKSCSKYELSPGDSIVFKYVC